MWRRSYHGKPLARARECFLARTALDRTSPFLDESGKCLKSLRVIRRLPVTWRCGALRGQASDKPRGGGRHGQSRKNDLRQRNARITSTHQPWRRKMTAALDQTILERRSIRKFLPAPVPRGLVDEALALAQHAPSNSNIQPWRLVFASGAARGHRLHAPRPRSG